MVKLLLPLIALLLFSTNSQNVYGQKLGFDKVLRENPELLTPFCLPNNNQNKKAIAEAGLTLKFETKNWLYITTTPSWIAEQHNSGTISDFYFEYAPPVALADTAKIWHNVNPVHNGQAPLPSAYTGKNVIVGVIDEGLDWTHPDFLDADGNTRVMRYWDHSFNGPTPAQPYGYGQTWDSTLINNGTCISSEETTAHGTTVAGIAVGNARANGTQKGMAPDANIIFIESNFNLPNWTLTIADAVDYVFKVADSLNMPAVVNLSLGSYFGSHDALDPAGEMIDALLDEHPGRIVVCAAGNSGDKGKYHLHNDVSSDTSFVWWKNNPSGQLGTNTVFFDLWTDMVDASWQYSFGANTAAPNYVDRGRLNFRNATTALNGVIYDTLYNNNGNRIACFEIYPEQVGTNYHMQVLAKIDSTTYLYRFETKGSGNYDLWSGSWLGFNDMEVNLPSSAVLPEIVYYAMPDTLQTIVSSWNCSNKVVSVGVFRNKTGYWDKNGNLYYSGSVIPGALNPGSSKGPTRDGIIKPDVAASGDLSLSAAPMWVLNDPAYNSYVDSGGWHARNGGTSMASPIVAGIAALYLERCSFASYANFKTDLFSTSYSDAFTGTLPNLSFGYGKPDAFALLQQQTPNTLTPTISTVGGQLISSVDYGYQWVLNGEWILGADQEIYNPIPPYGDYQVISYNSDGCPAYSNTLTVAAGIYEADQELIKLYPNPGKGIFHINASTSYELVDIVDVTGRPISFHEIGISHFEIVEPISGQYFVVIKDQHQNIRTVSLIIE